MKTVLLENHISLTSHEPMPVIKIDFTGKILFANGVGLHLLHKMGCTCSAALPKQFYKDHPQILQPHCFTDFQLEIDQLCFYFSAIAFDEAHYIGLYAYKIEPCMQLYKECA